MANLHRGEIAAFIGGAERRLRLTLGALADLEDAFGADDLGDLARRFSSGTLKSRDAVRVIGAGLRGAGDAVSDDEVATMHVEGGVAGYIDIVVRLVAATFGIDLKDGASERDDGEGKVSGDPLADTAAVLDRSPPLPSPGMTSSPSPSAGSVLPPMPSGR